MTSQDNMTSAINDDHNVSPMELLQWALVAETPTIGILLVALACFAHLLINAIHPKTCSPKLMSKHSSLSRHIIDTIPSLRKSYCPPIWANGPHAQTWLAMCLPVVNPEIKLECEYLQLKDEGLVALEWVTTEPTDCDDSAIHDGHQRVVPLTEDDLPIVLVIPPFWGYISIIHATCLAALARGFRPMVFRRRGSAGTPLTTTRLQSFGDASDFRQVVSYVLSKWPRAKMTVIGFSMGNGLLMSYLGEYGSSAHISAAVAISPVWDAPGLFENFPQPYGWFLLALKKVLLLKHAGALHTVVDIRAAIRSRTFTQLCETVYIPLYGHKNMEEFWDKNNPLRDVDDVAIPLLVIQSADDPIVSHDSTPYELFNVYPNFFLVKLTSGGHCAFLEGDSLNSWAVRMAFDYLNAVIKFVDSDTRLSNGK